MFLAINPADILSNGGLFLLLLVPLVLVHELGHFVAAKAFGIKVLEFGIGFPPRVKGLTWRRGETEYTVNWLPIGGFVRLLGEEDPSDPRSLAAAARWKRLTVMGAGVVMNFGLAILLFAAVHMIPHDRDLSQAQVVEVIPGSPAAEATITGTMPDGSKPAQGLQSGDIVKRVAGRSVENTNELIYANRLNLGEWQTWEIVRSGARLEARVYARMHPPKGQGPTGIRIGPPISCTNVDADGNPTNCTLLFNQASREWAWPWEALALGTRSLVDTVVLTKNEISSRIGGNPPAGNGDSQPAFTGPVGIAKTTGDIFDQSGWLALLELSALLSLNLGVFNALPIPMLDGGRMLFVVIEILRGGRRIAPEKEALVHLTGFALLMAGVLVVTYFDIARLVS